MEYYNKDINNCTSKFLVIQKNKRVVNFIYISKQNFGTGYNKGNKYYWLSG